MKTHYERRLPHILPPGATVFFTFRLAESIPVAVWQQVVAERDLAMRTVLQQATTAEHAQDITARFQKRHFATCDAMLDQAEHGPTWLREPAIAELLMREIRALAELKVLVLTYCIMANHVHLVVQLPNTGAFSASRMMQRLKGRTAVAANKLLGRQGGAFWQHESYDHVVRNGDEQARVIAYVVNNPVKAGLVEDWTQWPYTYRNVG